MVAAKRRCQSSADMRTRVSSESTLGSDTTTTHIDNSINILSTELRYARYPGGSRLCPDTTLYSLNPGTAFGSLVQVWFLESDGWGVLNLLMSSSMEALAGVYALTPTYYIHSTHSCIYHTTLHIHSTVRYQGLGCPDRAGT